MRRNDPASFIEVARKRLRLRTGTRTSRHGRMCCSSMRFSPGCGKQSIETVSSIAGQCDGVRCDMAMLLLNRSSNALGAAARGNGRQPSTGMT